MHITPHIPLSPRFAPLLTIAVFAGLVMLGFKLYHWQFLRVHTSIYIVGSLLVYWFSTSGAHKGWRMEAGP